MNLTCRQKQNKTLPAVMTELKPWERPRQRPPTTIRVNLCWLKKIICFNIRDWYYEDNFVNVRQHVWWGVGGSWRPCQYPGTPASRQWVLIIIMLAIILIMIIVSISIIIIKSNAAPFILGIHWPASSISLTTTFFCDHQNHHNDDHCSLIRSSTAIHPWSSRCPLHRS